VLKWSAGEDPFATWTLCNKTLDQIHLGFEYHQVTNLPFTPRQKKKKKQKVRKKSFTCWILSLVKMRRLKIETCCLNLQAIYIHVTRLSTRQEESISGFMLQKTLLLNWKCQNGEEKEREREREREGIDTTSDMRIESKKAHLLHKVLKLWEEFFLFWLITNN
jgi:hypothetical protein